MPALVLIIGVSFLDSPIVGLRCSPSARIFKIHQELLKARGGRIICAFERGFKEKSDGVYTITDTTEETLLRYMEWAYRNDYPSAVNEDSSQEPGAETKGDATDPRLCHVGVYIFANKYIIDKLEALAFRKLTRSLALVKDFSDNDSRTLIQVLDLALSNLPAGNSLLEWLGKYAAWRLSYLRRCTDFHDRSGSLAPFLIKYVQPSPPPPECDPNVEYYRNRVKPRW
ncbi:hypothetical protein AJ80_06626 [Polytolypa hystricis UAMH7299]|uniref:BTB domain-containing protein n=1 Tax=Polytolypa hystricis (strain UAMH7299) TaxID=1447883 RepID=A0A2B7XV83_POLH7|nr:hypothetical protein AJ80_06626 [Polytolypa hystricis UAMH7299]